MPATTSTADPVTADRIASYRETGFVHLPGIITPAEAATFREAALKAAARRESLYKGSIFTQLVNLWQDDETLRRLTLHPNLARAAEKLAGAPLRLWHDHTLIKQPHNNAATEFHQDQPYWPHANSTEPLSAWVALCDVPVERGCMTFIPGSKQRTELEAQRLDDDESLFTLCPDLRWSPRVTVPLRAGDCTFHHGRCAHMATPNFTDDPRVAHVVIFMEEQTTYVDKSHVVTDGLGLTPGKVIEGELFPTARQITAGSN